MGLNMLSTCSKGSHIKITPSHFVSESSIKDGCMGRDGYGADTDNAYFCSAHPVSTPSSVNKKAARLLITARFGFHCTIPTIHCKKQ